MKKRHYLIYFVLVMLPSLGLHSGPAGNSWASGFPSGAEGNSFPEVKSTRLRLEKISAARDSTVEMMEALLRKSSKTAMANARYAKLAEMTIDALVDSAGQLLKLLELSPLGVDSANILPMAPHLEIFLKAVKVFLDVVDQIRRVDVDRTSASACFYTVAEVFKLIRRAMGTIFDLKGLPWLIYGEINHLYRRVSNVLRLHECLMTEILIFSSVSVDPMEKDEGGGKMMVVVEKSDESNRGVENDRGGEADRGEEGNRSEGSGLQRAEDSQLGLEEIPTDKDRAVKIVALFLRKILAETVTGADCDKLAQLILGTLVGSIEQFSRLSGSITLGSSTIDVGDVAATSMSSLLDLLCQIYGIDDYRDDRLGYIIGNVIERLDVTMSIILVFACESVLAPAEIFTLCLGAQDMFQLYRELKSSHALAYFPDGPTGFLEAFLGLRKKRVGVGEMVEKEEERKREDRKKYLKVTRDELDSGRELMNRLLENRGRLSSLAAKMEKAKRLEEKRKREKEEKRKREEEEERREEKRRKKEENRRKREEEEKRDEEIRKKEEERRIENELRKREERKKNAAEEKERLEQEARESERRRRQNAESKPWANRTRKGEKDSEKSPPVPSAKTKKKKEKAGGKGKEANGKKLGKVQSGRKAERKGGETKFEPEKEREPWEERKKRGVAGGMPIERTNGENPGKNNLKLLKNTPRGKEKELVETPAGRQGKNKKKEDREKEEGLEKMGSSGASVESVPEVHSEEQSPLDGLSMPLELIFEIPDPDELLLWMEGLFGSDGDPDGKLQNPEKTPPLVFGEPFSHVTSLPTEEVSAISSPPVLFISLANSDDGGQNGEEDNDLRPELPNTLWTGTQTVTPPPGLSNSPANSPRTRTQAVTLPPGLSISPVGDDENQNEDENGQALAVGYLDFSKISKSIFLPFPDFFHFPGLK
ncbi:MAG: hypothetical protein LBU15_02550 [Rickettsiales bacterium]|nr:hypothetical protein [Rickettsiales bacterium]